MAEPVYRIVLPIALAVFLLVPGIIPAADTPVKGQLLVASEQIRDPRFSRTVILVLEHDTNGSVGLIINRPLKANLKHLLPKLSEFSIGEQVMHYGGPVEPQRIWVLIGAETSPEGALEILPGLHVTSLGALYESEQLDSTWPSVRVLSGYAGWASGQLEQEMKRGDWKVVDGSDSDVFRVAPEIIWDDLNGRGRPLII